MLELGSLASAAQRRHLVPGDLQLMTLDLHGGLLLQRVGSWVDVGHAHLRLSGELPCERKKEALAESSFSRRLSCVMFPSRSLRTSDLKQEPDKVGRFCCGECSGTRQLFTEMKNFMAHLHLFL